MLRNLMALIVMGVLAVSGFLFSVTQNLPPVEKALQDGVNPTKWTQVFSSDGTPIMSFGKFRHERVKLGNISPYFLDALIATEDRRFYTHKGVDPVAVMRAVVSDITHKKIREGGSTLTQQLARNVFLNNERSFTRKIREAAIAMEIEDKLTKKQILELYVNNTYFGEGAYGIQAASEIYFGKAPSQLRIEEAAMLAGMPQAPSAYSPFHNMKGAIKRRNEVIDNLKETGKITATQAESLKSKSLHLNPNGRSLSASNRAPFFNQYIMQRVMKFLNLDEQSFWQSGLKIHTTLNMNAQRLAEKAVANQSLAAGRTRVNQQAALLSLDTSSGAILAYVGGRDYSQSQFDRVVNATRSPGSLFKIFTYTAAIDKGYEPTRVYLDEPVRLGQWEPQNYDKAHHGYMTLARALITSNNIVAVKVIHELGANTVVQLAERMEIHTPLEPYLGLTLGGSGVKLMDITSAFGVLANQGVRVEPYGITRIIDESGQEIYREHAVRVNVLQRPTVDTMVRMMQGVVTMGTGKNGDIGRQVAGKTGTSDDYRDAWFVGFTPDVVTGVWVGNDNNAPMKGMTGGSLPARIWKGYMGPFMANRAAKDFNLDYAKHMKDEDFTTYNLRNLTDAAAPNSDNTELQPFNTPPQQDGLPGDGPQPLPDDNGGETDPDAPPQGAMDDSRDRYAEQESHYNRGQDNRQPPTSYNNNYTQQQPRDMQAPSYSPPRYQPQQQQQQPMPGYNAPSRNYQQGNGRRDAPSYGYNTRQPELQPLVPQDDRR